MHKKHTKAKHMTQAYNTCRLQKRHYIQLADNLFMSDLRISETPQRNKTIAYLSNF
jgi:hypothetical protein